MRSCHTLMLAVVVLASSSARVVAQNCKPTMAGTDKISKARVDDWSQDVYTTSFMAQVAVTTAEVNLAVSIGRLGDANAVRLVVTKEETNTARAVLESQFKAEKGNSFLLGFKEGGTPLTFTADQASSVTAATMMGKLKTTVVLTTLVKDEDLKALKDTIGTRTFDAIRATLSAMTIEKSIKGSNGKKLGEKFGCFFAFAGEKGFMK